MVKLFKWQRGRQSTCRYWKFPFAFFKIGRLGFDGYILIYPKEAYLPKHVDKLDGKMWRMNITLKGKSTFCIKSNSPYVLSGWKWSYKVINMFRPDLYEHCLYVHTRTYKLSLGFAIFNKKKP